jgi:hypothetical protein
LKNPALILITYKEMKILGNCQAVLEAAHVADLFDTRVDSRDLQRLDLKGKPAPDMFIEASHQLDSNPRVEYATVREPAADSRDLPARYLDTVEFFLNRRDDALERSR